MNYSNIRNQHIKILTSIYDDEFVCYYNQKQIQELVDNYKVSLLFND